MIRKIKYKLKIKRLSTERSTRESSICICTRGQLDSRGSPVPGGGALHSQTGSRGSCPWTPDRATLSEPLPWLPGLRHFKGHFCCLGYKQESILISGLTLQPLVFTEMTMTTYFLCSHRYGMGLHVPGNLLGFTASYVIICNNIEVFLLISVNLCFFRDNRI